jgi:hypothetical protein
MRRVAQLALALPPPRPAQAVFGSLGGGAALGALKTRTTGRVVITLGIDTSRVAGANFVLSGVRMVNIPPSVDSSFVCTNSNPLAPSGVTPPAPVDLTPGVGATFAAAAAVPAVALGGTFLLGVPGQITEPITLDWNATSGTVESAVFNLTGVQASVSSSTWRTGVVNSRVYVVSFDSGAGNNVRAGAAGGFVGPLAGLSALSVAHRLCRAARSALAAGVLSGFVRSVWRLCRCRSWR